MFRTSLYLSLRIFVILIGFILLFILSNIFPILFPLIKALFIIYIFIILVDIFLVYSIKKGINALRETANKYSNGQKNPVEIKIENYYPFTIYLLIIDEIPIQFQERNFNIKFKIKKVQQDSVFYDIRPTKRGIYIFRNINIYVASPLKLVKRKYIFKNPKKVSVYPDFSEIKKYSLFAFSSRLFEYGLKKIRKTSSTTEFEQIKDYALGDDIRNINWKATARRNQLMVNIYQDERSQPIYSLIDKSRMMLMPFNDLSLLDYSINSSLMISNAALLKNDKAGIITFSNSIHDFVKAERRNNQLNILLEALYKIKANSYESDFERLYIDIKKSIKQRSLIFLYTNFETMSSLSRQLPYLKEIAKNHLLVIIFFKNSELRKLMTKSPESVKEIFHQITAEKLNFEKTLIANTLQNYGIITLLTEPEKLTINLINKYLEIKSRNLL